MHVIIGLLILLTILILLKKFIGFALIIGSIGYGIYLLKNKNTFKNYSKTRKIVTGIIMLLTLSLGSTLALPDENTIEKTPLDHSNVVEQEHKSDGIALSPASSTENINNESDIDVQDNENEPKIQESEFQQATITKLVDGDTVYAELEDGTEHKVRLIGVNTPETKHPTKDVQYYGKEASAFTENSLQGKTVYLEKDVSDTDKYDRLLRYVWIEKPSDINEDEVKNKMFNAILVSNGYANTATYPPDVKYQDYFSVLENEAKENNIGLWNETKADEAIATNNSTDTNVNNSTENASVENTTPTTTVYVGNSNSYKFHESYCSHAKKIASHNRVELNSREKAINSGYVPCKVCNP